MKLLRLILQGFKSFADKTTIEFADGMTVIVGPNGCGKSNISDAVRWVLGEQNVRNLRGQKSEDIIFAGSESRTRKNGAEVTLVLDNSNRELPLDTAEVSITRRILRNGDSDFQINKRNCRLKDIHELLANTGLGKGSLAIIGQNRVDEVLTAKPEERRAIFEDVAGISLYRMRKNEGLQKLVKTAENMDRVKDMMAMLDEQTGPMKEKAEKAKAYKALAAEKRAVQATMSALKLDSIKESLEKHKAETETLEQDSVKWKAELTKAAAALAKLEQETLLHQEKVKKAGTDFAEAKEKLDGIRVDYKIKEEALEQEKKRTEELKEDEEDQKEAEEELIEEIQNDEEEMKAAEAEKADWLAKQNQAEAEKEKLAGELEASEKAYSEILNFSRQKMAEKQKLEQGLAYLDNEVRRLKGESSRREEAAKSIEGELQKTNEALASLLAEEKEAMARQEQLKEEGIRDRKALDKARNECFSIGNELNEAESSFRTIHSHREYLEKADKEYASFSRTTKTVMENRAIFGDAVHGALGELIHVPSEYTAAAEVALGSQISNIVTDTTKSAGDIIRWLKEKNLGRATFYPLESMKPSSYSGREQEASREEGILGIAADLFETDSLYQDLLHSLLGRTLIAKDLDAARRVSKKYGYRLRIVTLDGQIVNAGGSMTGGSMKKKENTYFGRKEEIKELYAEEKKREKDLADLRKRKQEKETARDSLSEKVAGERESWHQMDLALASLKGQKDGLEKTKTDQETRLKEGKDALASISESLEKFVQQMTEGRELLKTYEDIPEPGKDEKSLAIRKQIDDKVGELIAIREGLTKAESRASFAKRMMNDAKKAQEDQKKDREDLENKKKANEEAKKNLAETLEKLNQDFEEANGKWESIRTKQESLQGETDRYAALERDSQAAWRKAQEKSSSVEKDLADKKARLERFKEEEAEELQKISEEGMTREEVETLKLPGTLNEMKNRDKVLAGKIADLGTVNPAGEEEYEEHLKKRNFYEEQINDMRGAEEELRTVIKDIDEKMASQFDEAFTKVNQEFGRIMQIMFQGGSAKLELTDPEHPLECGVEMYLQLPGKKRQPLTLMSGGERALTVIALLISFMAYRPAPFCFVDEIDAALDDSNVDRYSRMIAEYKKKTQFIVISHRKRTMEFADTLQGVTMGERGVSSLVTVKMKDYVE